MHPILFAIGPLKLHSYGFMLAVAFLVGMWLAGREARRLGEDPEVVGNLSFWIIIAAVVGSRLFHVIVFWGELEPPRLWSAFKIWEGGLVYYGGFIGAVTASIVYARVRRHDIWQLADIIAPSIALGLMFGRIGCTLVGCCFGKSCPIDYPLAITFPPETIGRAGVPLYPTQPAEALGCLAIFLFLWFYARHHRRFRGQVILLFVVLYSALRFLLEFWRDDPRGHIALFTLGLVPGLNPASGGFAGWLTWARALLETSPGRYAVQISESQLVSVVLTSAAIPVWLWKSRRDRRLGVPVDPPAPTPASPAPGKRKGKKR